MSEQLERDLEKMIREVEKDFAKRVGRMIRKCEEQARNEKEDSFTRALYDYAPSGSDSLLASLESDVKVQLEQARQELPAYFRELRVTLRSAIASCASPDEARRRIQSILAVERKNFDRRIADLMGGG